MTTPIAIDGSHGEGGGQIIRNAVSLSCILRKPVKITSIRSNRPNPGLASQHLESILALKRISGATTDKELKKGLTSFQLNGDSKDPSQPIDTTIDLVTAGSVSLCVQVLLPYMLTLQTPSRLRIIGGTHVMKAPNHDYLKNVFIPNMKSIGYEFGIHLKRAGYFPRGGGSIQLEVEPLGGLHFKHFSMLDRGKLMKQSAILNVTPKLAETQPRFLAAIHAGVRDMEQIESRTVPYASVEYFLEFERTRIGFYRLVEGRNPTQTQLLESIQSINAEYGKFMDSSAALDEHMQDQLVIYMALAKLSDPDGASSIRVGPGALTDHTTSAVHVAELMTGVRFQLVEEESSLVVSI